MLTTTLDHADHVNRADRATANAAPAQIAIARDELGEQLMTTYAPMITRGSTRSRRSAVPALWRQVVRGADLDHAPAKGDDRVMHPGIIEPDRSAYTQLEIYEGLLRAFDRRTEVLEAIAVAPDREDAVRRVRELLEVTHLQAAAILDTQLHRFAAGSRDRIAHRAAELRNALIR